MELIKPSMTYLKSFRQYIKEYEMLHDDFYIDLYSDSKGSFKKYINLLELHSKGKKLPKGLTSYNTYWLIDYHEVIGVIRIRKKALHVIGNVGYDIRPSYRGEGYGKEILKLGKILAKNEMNLDKLFVSCHADNTASRKVIERNGGIFYKLQNGNNDETFFMYLINL